MWKSRPPWSAACTQRPPTCAQTGPAPALGPPSGPRLGVHPSSGREWPVAGRAPDSSRCQYHSRWYSLGCIPHAHRPRRRIFSWNSTSDSVIYSTSKATETYSKRPNHMHSITKIKRSKKYETRRNQVFTTKHHQ